MKTNYVLIDFENVQPKSLEGLNGHPFKVLLFVGANQAKIPYELAAGLQALGSDAQYVKIEGNGSNALDFHIAFHLGRLSEQDPQAYFHIISKDTGFDPLVRYLKSRNISAQRHKDLTDIPLLRMAENASINERVAAVVKNFAARGQSRPRKTQTLANAINALFLKALSDSELDAIISQMKKKKLIVVEEDKVIYRPPITQP